MPHLLKWLSGLSFNYVQLRGTTLFPLLLLLLLQMIIKGAEEEITVNAMHFFNIYCLDQCNWSAFSTFAVVVQAFLHFVSKAVIRRLDS